VPLHLHFCEGELQHITVLIRMEGCASETGKDEPGCCKNKRRPCNNELSRNSCCDDATQWLQDDLAAICLTNVHGDEVVSTLSAVSPESVVVPLHDSPSVYPDLLTSSGPPLYIFQCALVYYG
jgi:hypothetical protein